MCSSNQLENVDFSVWNSIFLNDFIMDSETARTVSLLTCDCSPCGPAEKEARVSKGLLYI